MSSSSQNSRERAEAAFVKNQTQTLSRMRLIREGDDLNEARDAKTLRLRAMRYAKDAHELALAAAAVAPAKKRQR